ncbi:Outer membrane protein assembly factor BamE [Castellaniella defragrans]
MAALRRFGIGPCACVSANSLYDSGFGACGPQAPFPITGAFVRIRASTQSHRMKICLVTGMLTLSLAGCGTTNWGFPYRTTVQQGNWITSEQVAQLQVGMTRDQVRFILGTPTLQDAFHADRWDYPFYNQPGYGKDELRKFTVWFKDDKLVRWEGDRQPDRQPFQKIDSGREAISNKPDTGNSASQATSPTTNSSATPNQQGLDNTAPPATTAPVTAPSGATETTTPHGTAGTAGTTTNGTTGAAPNPATQSSGGKQQ